MHSLQSTSKMFTFFLSISPFEGLVFSNLTKQKLPKKRQKQKEKKKKSIRIKLPPQKLPERAIAITKNPSSPTLPIHPNQLHLAPKSPQKSPPSSSKSELRRSLKTRKSCRSLSRDSSHSSSRTTSSDGDDLSAHDGFSSGCDSGGLLEEGG